MHKIDPNDMDALFREGADKHEFVYNPVAWDMMEDKLDKRDRRKTLLWFFLGLLLVAGSIYGYMHFNTDNIPQAHIANQSSQALSEVQEVEKTILEDLETQKLNKESLQNSNTAFQSLENNTNTVVTSNTEVATNEDIKEEYIKTGSEVRSRNIGAQNSGNTGSLVDNEVVSVAQAAHTKNSEVKDSNIAIDNSIVNTTPLSTKSTLLPNTRALLSMELLENRESLGIHPNLKQVLDFDLNPVIVENQVFPIVSSSRYVFTGYANADFSSVGLFTKARAGYKVGFKIGKQFSDRFQFGLGLAYSHKRYGSEGYEYTRPSGWGVDDIEPTWMDAKCDVLEIPLEFSYYLKGFKNDGFFINAGISSYLVNSEWYGFKYDETGMEPGTTELLVKEINPDQITDKNYHITGAGKFSVGYQKIVSSNMAFEVSPYIQIPLTGIGEGKVNLYSTGVQFAVKFNSK